MAVSLSQVVSRAALAVAALAAVASARSAAPAPPDTPKRLAAGFRFSTYGPDYDPGPAYWKRVGERMAERFPGSVPGAVWIVGRLKGRGCELSFPGRSTDPLVQFTSGDLNEAALDLFDATGFKVWLQVEPGHAPVKTLIDLVLARYKHHPSVVGFGIDVEWYRSVAAPEGQAVTDAEARAWLAAVRAHGPRYRLFLKHWLTQKMPPTVRDGLFFIDDSQILSSLDAMVDEFAVWARTFAPAPVGFQIGYDSDRKWWEKLKDPPAEIGRRILAAAPNTAGLYWVDFSVLDVFPPESPTIAASPSAPTRRRIGVKIYEHEGDQDALFRTWADLGINSVFAGEALAGAPGFRAKAAERGVDLFVIAPVFYNPRALAEDPSLVAITAAGTPAREEWVEFVCPSNPAYRAGRVREIREAVARIRPDGLSLDFLRHFVFWEKVPVAAAPDSLPNACFCDRCVAAFAARAGPRSRARPGETRARRPPGSSPSTTRPGPTGRSSSSTPWPPTSSPPRAPRSPTSRSCCTRCPGGRVTTAGPSGGLPARITRAWRGASITSRRWPTPTCSTARRRGSAPWCEPLPPRPARGFCPASRSRRPTGRASR
jgi:hypothetical protein